MRIPPSGRWAGWALLGLAGLTVATLYAADRPDRPEAKPLEEAEKGEAAGDRASLTGKTPFPPGKRIADPPAKPARSKRRHTAETAKPSQRNPALNDILRARRQHGSLLQGTLFENIEGQPSIEDAFDKALRDLVRKQPPLTSPSPKSRISPRSDTIFPGDDSDLIASLRLSSRLLDRKAHDLESQRRFDKADEYRELAQRLLQQARQIDGAPAIGKRTTSRPDRPSLPGTPRGAEKQSRRE